MVTIFSLTFRRYGGRPATIAEAAYILGRDRVFRAKRVRKCWGATTSLPQDPVLCYTRANFEQCARANEKGRSDWRLVYVIGLSLRHIHRLRGQGSIPCLFEGNTMWLKPEEDIWATRIAPGGYYLIDFRLRYTNRDWESQEARIIEKRKECARLPENVTVETVFSVQMITGKRLLEKELHSGPSVDSFGYHVKVGYNDINGVVISSVDSRRKDSGAILYLKPQAPAGPITRMSGKRPDARPPI